MYDFKNILLYSIFNIFQNIFKVDIIRVDNN